MTDRYFGVSLQLAFVFSIVASDDSYNNLQFLKTELFLCHDLTLRLLKEGVSLQISHK